MKAHVIADHKADILRAGLAAAGYGVVNNNSLPEPEDVLVTWNRKPSNEKWIKQYERIGAKVIIAENGYIGRDDNGNKLISLAHNYHLGAGRWYVGAESRHLNHNFSIEPWRTGGEEIVILAQRGIGNSKNLDWFMKLAERIKCQTSRPVRVRRHPGKNPTPLLPDIKNAHAVITWSSSAALHAMALGVPVFYLMKGWMGGHAATFGIDDLEAPLMSGRENVFHRVGWAQWTTEEILSGKAINTVMSI